MRAAWLLAAVLVVADTPAAEVYKWTDAKGVVHYGSQPPADVQAERQKVRGAGEPTPVPATTDAPADPGTQPADGASAARTAQAENARRLADYERQRCDYARRQLAESQKRRAPRVREVRGSEQRTKLIGEQRAEQAQHQADVASYCKP